MRGARVSEFFHRDSNPNLIFFFLRGGVLGRVRGAGVDGCTDEQAQTNFPLQLLRS